MAHKKKTFFVLAILKETIRKFFADNGLFLASGLSFDLLLYCMPLALLLVSGLGFTLVGSDQALAWVQESFQHFLPVSQKAFFDALTRIISNRGPLGLVGFVAFFVLSSAVFGSIRIILNMVFRVSKPSSLLRGKCKDFLMMVAVSVLLLLTIGIELLDTIINTLGEQHPDFKGVLHQGWELMTDVLGFCFTAALFYLLYRYSPGRTLRPQSLVVGCLTGAALFALSKLAFAWYVFFAQSITGFYGALGGFLFFFLWLFYSSTVFVLGAEVSWAYQHIRSSTKEDS